MLIDLDFGFWALMALNSAISTLLGSTCMGLLVIGPPSNEISLF